MSLQKLYSPLGLATKNYPVTRFDVKIALLSACSATIVKPVTITWDPLKTSVTSAQLVMKAHSNADPTDVYIKFNGVEIKIFQWGEGTRCTEQSDIIEVPIINGANKIEVRTCKRYPWIGVVSVYVDAVVTVNFEGETPTQPWWELIQEWIEANWQWIAVGTGLIIIGGVSYMYIARPRGK